VGVGVFGYFHANAAAAPDEDCIEFAVAITEYLETDVSTLEGVTEWQYYYFWCIGKIVR